MGERIWVAALGEQQRLSLKRTVCSPLSQIHILDRNFVLFVMVPTHLQWLHERAVPLLLQVTTSLFWGYTAHFVCRLVLLLWWFSSAIQRLHVRRPSPPLPSIILFNSLSFSRIIGIPRYSPTPLQLPGN